MVELSLSNSPESVKVKLLKKKLKKPSETLDDEKQDVHNLETPKANETARKKAAKQPIIDGGLGLVTERKARQLGMGRSCKRATKFVERRVKSTSHI